jgi:predicted ATPase
LTIDIKKNILLITSHKTALLIGAPSTGKTSVLQALRAKGFICYDEISRQVTIEARKEGITHLFKQNPLLFSEKLLDGRIQQFRDSLAMPNEWAFLDRGLPDITAYMDMVNQVFPDKFEKANSSYIYEKVFWFPVWNEIYQQDNVRYEDFKMAGLIEKYLLKWYRYYNYDLIEVPKTSVSKRVEFITSKL